MGAGGVAQVNQTGLRAYAGSDSHRCWPSKFSHMTGAVWQLVTCGLTYFQLPVGAVLKQRNRFRMIQVADVAGRWHALFFNGLESMLDRRKAHVDVTGIGYQAGRAAQHTGC